jgi:hypothetical protein
VKIRPIERLVGLLPPAFRRRVLRYHYLTTQS